MEYLWRPSDHPFSPTKDPKSKQWVLIPLTSFNDTSLSLSSLLVYSGEGSNTVWQIFSTKGGVPSKSATWFPPKIIQDQRIERKWKFYFIQWEASDILSHFFHYGSINLAKRVIATPPSIKVLPLIGIKMYKCSLCENEFAWRANLTRHMSAHTGEKTYNCNQCDFATAWPSNYRTRESDHWLYLSLTNWLTDSLTAV